MPEVEEYIMKITSVDVFECKPNVTGGIVCIRINTDEGISGFGEVGLSYGKAHHAAVGIARDYAQIIIGMNPENTEAIWEHIFRITFWGMGGGAVINAGMSAIDTALWDIKGKAANLPVYKLLGGKTNATIRVYASQLQFDWDDKRRLLTFPEQYAEATRKAKAQGFTAVKVDPIDVTMEGRWAREDVDPDWKVRGKMSNRMINIAYERVAAIREAGGEDLDIIIELHSYTDAITAIQLGQKLQDLDIYYCEEPVHPLNVDKMLEIQRNINIPIATGERIYTRWGFRQFLEKGAVQIIQPDLSNTGGITETKKICDMANIYDGAVQLHICGGPISIAASLHVEAVIPNFLIHEFHEGAIKKNMRELCVYDYMPVKGNYAVPELPGIGQELTEKAMAEANCFSIE